MSFNDVLEMMIKKNASDAFIRAASKLRMRICTEVETITDYEFSVKDVDKIVSQIIDDVEDEG